LLREILPDLAALITRCMVISFVNEAGGISSWGFFEKRTTPVSASISTAASEVICGVLSRYGARKGGTMKFMPFSCAGREKQIKRSTKTEVFLTMA
jgi:hypothetical protein